MSQFFPEIGKVAADDDNPVEEIESLCMKCHQQGTTRMLLTSIPYFREIVVMSFRCEHCGFSNNEIQTAGTIRPEGTLYVTKILDRSDLDRQIVRSESCEIQIPELELTLPPSLRGQMTTVEGLIRDIYADLSTDQPLRKYQDEVSYNAIQKILDKLAEVLGDEESSDNGEVQVGKASQVAKPMFPFTLKLDDPSGNSFIEFIGSMADPKWNVRTYPRSLGQNVQLGLAAAHETPEDEKPSEPSEEPLAPDEEVFTFPGTCSSCAAPSNTMMKKVNIPYFKDVIIMSTNCEKCGYRDNEVKSGSAISEQGKRITLKVEDEGDLSRDILKSETAGLQIPEIALELSHGTLGGRFTTIEGLLEQVYEELAEKTFYQGDSVASEDKPAFGVFLMNLKACKAAERPFTIILEDPLANSYIQNLYAPDPDPNLTSESYDRTWEQNEELGLNDIKVEGYEQDAVPVNKLESVAEEETKST